MGTTGGGARAARALGGTAANLSRFDPTAFEQLPLLSGARAASWRSAFAVSLRAFFAERPRAGAPGPALAAFGAFAHPLFLTGPDLFLRVCGAPGPSPALLVASEFALVLRVDGATVGGAAGAPGRLEAGGRSGGVFGPEDGVAGGGMGDVTGGGVGRRSAVGGHLGRRLCRRGRPSVAAQRAGAGPFFFARRKLRFALWPFGGLGLAFGALAAFGCFGAFGRLGRALPAFSLLRRWLMLTARSRYQQRHDQGRGDVFDVVADEVTGGRRTARQCAHMAEATASVP